MSNNIEFYCNIFKGYSLFSDQPPGTNVGGIGIYVKSDFNPKLLSVYKIQKSDKNRNENIWLQVMKNGEKYIIGGCYRHRNQSIQEFNSSLEQTHGLISSQKLPCIFVGDINIDLLKYEIDMDTINQLRQ